jgi:uncharacterized protein YjbI with pentapeptide repeats
MANQNQVEMLRHGRMEWNRWRSHNPGAEIDLRGADLREADLHMADLSRADLSGANLTRSNLADAWLCDANLTEANLLQASLGEAKLMNANLTKATLRAAHLGRASFANAISREADLSFAVFAGGPTSLQECDFTSAILTNVNFDDIRGSGVVMRGAQLNGANFHRAKLDGVNFIGAQLMDTSFTNCDLSGADFSNANLYGANLVRVNVNRAKFSQALMGWTVLGSLDLSTCIDLDLVEHRTPSTLGMDTIVNSQGRIPTVFLRGCGLPDNVIDYIGSIVKDPIQYHSCFISYATKDSEFAQRLYADLQSNNVRSYYAPEDLQGGKKIHEQLDEAIQVHDKLLLIISEHSMKSEWVKTEIAIARKREVTEKRKILFPVRLVSMEQIKQWRLFDADIGGDSAKEIREYFIPDFSNWRHDHDSYANEFRRLLKDLKASNN